jgi:DNA polymerase-4
MILHLDLDCFFASAHRTLDKSLLDKPIAVGGRSNLKIFEKRKMGIKLYDSNSGAFVNPLFYNEKQNDFKSFFVDRVNGKDKIRGIITTASYEARDFGVKTAMSVNEALQRCPNLTVLTPNYLLYHELSHQLHSFLKDEIPSIEQYSIDEFFGDVNGWITESEVLTFAINLQKKIKQRFDLPISIGIAEGKWIAKLATNEAKPNGVCFISKGEMARFIENIPIEKFAGIGKAYQKRLQKYGITTLGEASRNKTLFYQWKKPGIQLYKRIIGDDHEGILKSNDRKSIGISRTFDPIKNKDEMSRRVVILARHIIYMVFKLKVNPTTYYIGVKYDHGQRVKGRKTINRIFSEQLAKEIFLELFHEIDLPNATATKLSMSVSNFSYQKLKTLSLVDIDSDLKEQKLSLTIQKMRQKYSLDIIKSANEL